jgi:RimJ/RimL family protein N-acetyltransferase
MDVTQPMPAWTPPAELPGRWQTARLVLRWWEQGDASGLFEAVSTSRPTLLPWLPWVNTEHHAVHESVYAIEKMKRQREAPGTTDYTLAIIDRAGGGVVGGTGLHRIRPDAHEAEIGYWVRATLRGRGLCTEATAGLISWAFTPQHRGGWGLRRVHIRCAGANGASARVPEKLGLRPEARLVQERWVTGAGWQDTLVWGVLADEWDLERSAMR